jgi:hypothetical protein
MASAISTLIGYTILLILNYFASQPYIKWRFSFRTLRNVSASSTGMGMVAWGIYKTSARGNKYSTIFLILSIGAAFLTYFIGLWFLGEIKEDEKSTILKIWYRVLGKKMAR